MTNDQFTEWLTNRFLFYRRRKNDLLLSEKERIQAEAKETECADCIYQYRQLAPTWIPVTPEAIPPVDTCLTEYIKGLEIKIRDCNSGLNEVSWGYQDGILISKQDAIVILSYLKLLPTPPIK